MVKLRILAATTALLFALAPAARATPVPGEGTPGDVTTTNDESGDGATKSEIQSVITKQLDALRRDDAAGAEAFAAPAIQEQFGEPDKFLDMVKEHYAALINPKSTSFGETAASPHGPLQKVTVVAADGTVWTAVYSFERVSGAWRISGVGLMKNEGQQDI